MALGSNLYNMDLVKLAATGFFFSYMYFTLIDSSPIYTPWIDGRGRKSTSKGGTINFSPRISVTAELFPGTHGAFISHDLPIIGTVRYSRCSMPPRYHVYP